MITVTNIERVRRGIWLRKHSEKEKSHITNHGARYILGEQSAIDKQHYISSKHVSFPQKTGKKNCYLKRRPNRPITTNTFHLYPRTILTESSLAKVYVAICPLLSSTLSTKKISKTTIWKITFVACSESYQILRSICLTSGRREKNVFL